VGGSPAPTFNQAFSLTGETTPVPEPVSAGLVAIGLLALAHRRTRR
jgi:MYXO-CTERM domain-containing protein